MSESDHGSDGRDLKRIVRRVFRILIFPIVVLLSLSKGALLLLMAGAIALSVATATVSSVFNMVSSAVEAVFGPRTVRAKQTARLTALSNEGAALRSRASALDDENRRLTREIADTKKTYGARVSSLVDENQRLTQELAERKVSYRGKPAFAREAVKDTANKVTTRITIASTRNVASVFAESLPVFGIAVILGATAWELSDACAMMDDLHELDVAFNPDNAIDGKEICGMQVPTRTEVLKKLRDSPADAWNAVKEYVPELPNFEPIYSTFPDFSESYQSGIEWARDLYCGLGGCEVAGAHSE